MKPFALAAGCHSDWPSFDGAVGGTCHPCYLEARGISAEVELDEILPLSPIGRRRKSPVAQPAVPDPPTLEWVITCERQLVFAVVFGPQILEIYPNLMKLKPEWFADLLCAEAWRAAMGCSASRPGTTESLGEAVMAKVDKSGKASPAQIRRFLFDLERDPLVRALAFENIGYYARVVMAQHPCPGAVFDQTAGALKTAIAFLQPAET